MNTGGHYPSSGAWESNPLLLGYEPSVIFRFTRPQAPSIGLAPIKGVDRTALCTITQGIFCRDFLRDTSLFCYRYTICPLKHTGIRTQTFFLTTKIWRIRVAVCISSHPNGTRTRISSVKGWYPRPVRRWGVNSYLFITQVTILKELRYRCKSSKTTAKCLPWSHSVTICS